MKTKDLVYLIIAVAIFAVAGYVGFTQLMPKSGSSQKGVTVEVVGEIPDKLNADALKIISDNDKVQDFESVISFDGLNNTLPFGR